jgi:hypothetical protein
MNELAEDREKCAARSERNAQSGREAAADPNLSDTTRRQAATAAVFADRHAREYREDAAKLREGYLPGEDW